MQTHYNTKRSIRTRIICLAIAAGILFGTVFVLALGRTLAGAEEQLITCWILCRPGSQVNVRRTPEKNAQVVGFLEVGDEFLTDAANSNGYIRAKDIGEYGEGWIFCGYVATEEPVPVYETYVCAAKTRVACRRWMNGPQTERPWLANGSTVQVFHIAGEWACTSRGYIKSEWLEADPQ